MNNLHEDHLIYRDSQTVLRTAIAKGLASCELSTYASVNGGFQMGCIDWATKNVRGCNEKRNAKYTGWEIELADEDQLYRMYIPNWVVDLMDNPKKPYGLKVGVFNKYLKWATPVAL